MSSNSLKLFQINQTDGCFCFLKDLINLISDLMIKIIYLCRFILTCLEFVRNEFFSLGSHNCSGRFFPVIVSRNPSGVPAICRYLRSQHVMVVLFLFVGWFIR